MIKAEDELETRDRRNFRCEQGKFGLFRLICMAPHDLSSLEGDAVKPMKITGRNIMFTEKMGELYNLNIGLILGKRHNFIIDTGLGSGSVAPVIEYIGNDKKPVIVVNTHCHWDHIWGNWVFENSIIIAHRKCRELEDKFWEDVFAEFGKYSDAEVRKCLPNLVFEDELYFPDDGVGIFFTPGHSEDCISVYDESEKVLYAGDNIGDTKEIIVPYIDTDYETFKKVIGIYKKYDFDICISGHNNPQGKNVVELMENALDDCWEKQLEEDALSGRKP